MGLLTASRFHRQKRTLVVTSDIHISGFDFCIQACNTADMLAGQNRKREINQEDQSNNCMQEVRQERRFQASHDRIHDD